MHIGMMSCVGYREMVGNIVLRSVCSFTTTDYPTLVSTSTPTGFYRHMQMYRLLQTGSAVILMMIVGCLLNYLQLLKQLARYRLFAASIK